MKMARSSLLLIFLISLSAVGLKADEDISFSNMASMFLQNMGETGDGDNLPSLGSIMGSFLQNSENPGDNAGKLLSGLGNMLGGQGGKLDPSIIGSVMSMLSQGASDPNKPKRRSTDNPADNLGDILNVASAFLGGNNVGNSAAGILPVLMNTLNSLSASEVQKRSDDHKDHSQFLPPFLEKIHLYWDIFISSELGRTIWEKSGLKKATKAFTGPDGKISVEMMLKNFENHSFRRHWIKAAAGYLTDVVIHVAKPEVYQRYLKSVEYIVNTFLDAQGLPRSVHFNLKKPEKSITSIVNYVLRKYLDTDTDVSGYVSSALAYLKQLLKMAETTTKSFASRGDYQALTDRVTDTLNLEVIEPVLRVFRAYKHSVQAPQCSEHLICLVNRDSAKGKSGLPGFKAGLTKISSLVASAALSYQNGGGFWDLYNAMQSDINCEAKYPADCNAFHEHEMKVTTEVYHNEL